MRECMPGLYSHSREQRKILLRDHFLHISQILEGIRFGVNTCRACIRTGANTGKNSWRIIYVTGPQLGPFFCREIPAFTGLGARFLQPLPKSLLRLSDRKVLFKHNMAINSR